MNPGPGAGEPDPGTEAPERTTRERDGLGAILAVLALGLVVAHMQIGFTIFAPAKVSVIDKLYDLLYWYMFVGSILLSLLGAVLAARLRPDRRLADEAET